jgi:hypothetical protein
MDTNFPSEKKHYLDQLQAELARWEALLAGLSEAQIISRDLPDGWSIKDVVAHLMAWQTVTNARLQAALQGREPEFTDWPAGLEPDEEEHLEAINAWIYASQRERDWPSVFADWRAGFNRVLEAARALPEDDLLEAGRYPWIAGYPLAAILDGTTEHHREHYENLMD